MEEDTMAASRVVFRRSSLAALVEAAAEKGGDTEQELVSYN